MANAKPAIAAIVILVLLQVSWATAHRYHQHNHMHAVMTVFHFGEHGGRGHHALGCDRKYHRDHELVVALPSKWFAGGRRCGQTIRITSPYTGRTVLAKVVQACHRCKNNAVGSSPAVWRKLGLDPYNRRGKVHVTWSDA